MTTYFLKFPNEETAQIVLETAEIYVAPIDNNPGYYKQADIGWAFDPIGTIIKNNGVYDQKTGEQLVAPTFLEGWHCNYIGESLPEPLQDYALVPAPSTPYRVFA
jgi:hypothetical protein